MRKLILLPFLFFMLIDTHAQIVSLNQAELDSLNEKIHTNKTYQKVFGIFLATANQALTETPNPILKINSQGLLKGNSKKTATLKAIKDTYKVYSLALVYRYSGDRKYFEKAVDFLMAWAKVNKPTGDPINETKLEDLITGYDLIRDKVSLGNRSTIDAWLSNVADTELKSPYMNTGNGRAFSNWNSHRIKIITLINYTLHNKKYDQLIAAELKKQLSKNLNPDGTTFDFMERDAFHYHLYDLEPLLTTCIVLYRATGVNYFEYKTADGASVEKSVDFMIPYMTGAKIHNEFVKSKVRFDIARAENHEKGYVTGTIFDPENGLTAFSLASFFNLNYVKVIKHTQGITPDYFNWQLALNSVRKPMKKRGTSV